MVGMVIYLELYLFHSYIFYHIGLLLLCCYIYKYLHFWKLLHFYGILRILFL